jgi:hypothetical protein
MRCASQALLHERMYSCMQLLPLRFIVTSSSLTGIIDDYISWYQASLKISEYGPQGFEETFG